MIKRIFFGLVCFLALRVTAEAAYVTLAWDADPNTDVAGYVVSYGTQENVYTSRMDVGRANLAVVTNLTAGTRYYFTVHAYASDGMRSPDASAVSTVVVAAVTPRNSAALGRSDFDGDSVGELSVYRPESGEWFFRFSSTGFSYANWTAYQWGGPGDVPVSGDFDGDRRNDLAVWRPSTGEWWIRYSSD